MATFNTILRQYPFQNSVFYLERGTITPESKFHFRRKSSFVALLLRVTWLTLLVLRVSEIESFLLLESNKKRRKVNRTLMKQFFMRF